MFSYHSRRYHPACMGMTIEEAKKLDHFECFECSEDDVKRSILTGAQNPSFHGKNKTWTLCSQAQGRQEGPRLLHHQGHHQSCQRYSVLLYAYEIRIRICGKNVGNVFWEFSNLGISCLLLRYCQICHVGLVLMVNVCLFW